VIQPDERADLPKPSQRGGARVDSTNEDARAGSLRSEPSPELPVNHRPQRDFPRAALLDQAVVGNGRDSRCENDQQPRGAGHGRTWNFGPRASSAALRLQGTTITRQVLEQLITNETRFGSGRTRIDEGVTTKGRTP